MEALLDDYDGLFDTTYSKNAMAENVRSIIDEIANRGMSQKLYNVATETHPDVSNVINFRKLTENPSNAQQSVALEFFDNLVGYLPIVTVKEENELITVTGIPTSILENVIYKEWKTNRIVKHMFTKMSSRYFQFHSFFAVEVVYILRKILTLKAAPMRVNGTIKSIINGLLEHTWLAETQDATPLPIRWEKLKRFNVTPLKKQSDFLEEFARHVPKTKMNGIMLYADPGTGKTISGYMWHTVNDYDVTIVTCPRNAVLDVWEKTILTNFEDEPKYFHSLMNKEIDGDEEFIIVHYEYLGKLLDQLNKIKGRRIGVWLDESHNLNEMKSLRTETFNNICIQSNAEAVVWASGTPLKAIGKEAVPLFRSIVHNFNKNVEEAFIKIFGASKGFALDILNNRMEMSMYRIRKDEVVVNEVDEITIPIKIPDATPYLLPTVAKDVRDYVAERLEYYRVNKREYEDSFTGILDRFESMYMVSDNKDWKRYRDYTRSMHRSFDQRRDKDLVVWCKDYERRVIIPKLDSATKKEFDRVASVYKYVILTVRGEALGRILTKRRIECFKAMVEHTDFDTIINTARKKTLIFTSYVAVVDEIATKVNKFKPLKVYGDTNNELARIMRTFKNDPKANPLIATYNSLSTAVPIIEASTCVLFNSPFRQYIRDQATARLDRLGQDGPVLILVPILDTGETKNLSSRSLDIQKYYSEMVDKILGLDGQPQSKAA